MEGGENEYHVKAGTQANLKKLEKEKRSIEADIKIEHEDVKRELDINVELTASTGQFKLFEGEKGAVSDAIRSNGKYKIMSVRGKKATFTSLQLTELCSEFNRINEEYKKE